MAEAVGGDDCRGDLAANHPRLDIPPDDTAMSNLRHEMQPDSPVPSKASLPAFLLKDSV